MSPDRSATKRFPCFDGLRCLAALSILVLHVGFQSGFNSRASLGTYTARLDVGVSIFFLISGFLLYRPFVEALSEGRASRSYGKFMTRRLLRIIPAYWLALAIIAFVLNANEVSDFGAPVRGFKAITIYFGFGQIYDSNYVQGGITSAWSLCTEISFYLFLPIYASAVRWIVKRGPGVVATQIIGIGVLYLTSLVFRLVMLRGSFDDIEANLALQWLPSTLDLFALGMGLAVLSVYSDGERFPARIGATLNGLGDRPVLSWTIALSAFLIAAHLLGLPRDLGHHTDAMLLGRQAIYGVAALFLIVPAVFGDQSAGLLRKLLTSRVMVLGGTISYGVYLWHEAWLHMWFSWTDSQLFGTSFPKLLGVVSVLSIEAAALSYFLVEVRFLKLKARNQ